MKDPEQARRQDRPGDRQVEAGATGRVQAGSECARSRQAEERRPRVDVVEIGNVRVRTRDEDDPGDDRDEGECHARAERFAGRNRDHRRHRALSRRDRGDHADAPHPEAGVDEQQAADIREAGDHEPADGRGVEAFRVALGERDGSDDDEAGQHHPRERRVGADQPARPRGGQRRDRPGDRGAEAAENRPHTAL